MMRRWTSWCLFSLLVCCAAGSLAEDMYMEVTVDYEGAWVSFTEENFKLYLPSGWMLVEPEEGEAGFVAVSADMTQAMWIDLYAAEDVTIDGVLESFRAAEGFEGVKAVYFNDVAFVCYTSTASDLFGAVTMSGQSV